MNEDKRLFVMRLDNKLKLFKNIKLIKKLLSIKNRHIRKCFRKVLEFLIIIKYEHSCRKCCIRIIMFRNNILCEISIKKYTERNIFKTVNKLNKIIKKYNTKEVILSNELKQIEELKRYFHNDKIIKGKYLKTIMIDDIIKYIVSINDENMENQTIHILAYDYSKINLEIIEDLASRVKCVNIVTNRLRRYLKYEKELYEKKEIMITVSNNKRKSLIKSKLIINLDFTSDLIKQYKINRNAIIINLAKENIEVSRTFNGLVINGLIIKKEFMKNNRNLKLYKCFDETVVYESNIELKKSFQENEEIIQKDNVSIKALIGTNRSD